MWPHEAIENPRNPSILAVMDDAANERVIADCLAGCRFEADFVPRLDDVSVRLRVSVGAAWFPQDGDTPDGLLRAAQAALEEARALGDSRYQLFRGHDLPPWPEDVVNAFRLPEPVGTGTGESPAGAQS